MPVPLGRSLALPASFAFSSLLLLLLLASGLVLGFPWFMVSRVLAGRPSPVFFLGERERDWCRMLVNMSWMDGWM